MSLDVLLTEFAISPETIHAPVGQAFSFSVTNDGTAHHTFAVETGNEAIETPELQPGETRTLAVSALEAGDYRTLCTISGHEGLGMVGTLMVMAGGEIAAGASGATRATSAGETVHAGHRMRLHPSHPPSRACGAGFCPRLVTLILLASRPEMGRETCVDRGPMTPWASHRRPRHGARSLRGP